MSGHTYTLHTPYLFFFTNRFNTHDTPKLTAAPTAASKTVFSKSADWRLAKRISKVPPAVPVRSSDTSCIHLPAFIFNRSLAHNPCNNSGKNQSSGNFQKHSRNGNRYKQQQDTSSCYNSTDRPYLLKKTGCRPSHSFQNCLHRLLINDEKINDCRFVPSVYICSKKEIQVVCYCCSPLNNLFPFRKMNPSLSRRCISLLPPLFQERAGVRSRLTTPDSRLTSHVSRLTPYVHGVSTFTMASALNAPFFNGYMFPFTD